MYENTASDWLTELLWYIRKNTENENLITVLIIPPTYVTAMKMFRQNSVNSLVDYYVLKYYDTKQDDYTDGNKVF